MEDHGAPSVAGAQTSLLTIRLVRVQGDTVTGRMEPYTDPDCQCTVETTFRGVLRGDTISGTFKMGLMGKSAFEGTRA